MRQLSFKRYRFRAAPYPGAPYQTISPSRTSFRKAARAYLSLIGTLADGTVIERNANGEPWIMRI